MNIRQIARFDICSLTIPALLQGRYDESLSGQVIENGRMTVRNWSDRGSSWLIAGVVLGVALASYWPHEPVAYAQAAAEADKFALCTVNTNVGDADAIFVLDYTTGRLIGATFNNKVNQFSQPMIRNLAADFGLTESGTFLMVPGFVNARGRGAQPATGGIYVAELTTGKLVLYGFINVSQGTRVPQELSVLGMFPWRTAS